MAMDERLLELMHSQHWNQQNFAEFLGISPATLSSILKKRTKVTLSTVLAIKKKFPTLNYSWLLDGVGPMFIDDKSGGSNSSSTPSSDSSSEPFIDFEQESVKSDEVPGTSDDSPVRSDSTSSGDAAISDPRQLQSRVGAIPNSGHSQRSNPNIVTAKNINILRRNVSQILVIYDDQTCETFVPKK